MKKKSEETRNPQSYDRETNKSSNNNSVSQRITVTTAPISSYRKYGYIFLASALSTLIQAIALQYFLALKILKGPRDLLAGPSGLENTGICLMMHCQSKDEAIIDCWDTYNTSIQSLARKGLSRLALPESIP